MPRFPRNAGVLFLHAVLSTRALMQRKVSGSLDGGLDSDDGSPSYGMVATGSQEENATMWEETFEKVFTVQLNMSRAREAGMPLGVKVDVRSEFEPLGVQMIRTGLAQEWNDANPDREIHVGDQITAVNGHAWHQDTRVFAERIKTMFKAAKEGTPGAEASLNMTIQRPRRQDMGLPLRLADQHQRLYTKGFQAQLDIPGSKVEQTLADALGWQLNVSVDYWMPVVVGEIRQQGLVAEWNERNPERTIFPGDEIVAVNDVTWQHNSFSFIEKVVKQFEASRSGETDPKGSYKLVLSVLRPKPPEALAQMRLAKLRDADEVEEAKVNEVKVAELKTKDEAKVDDSNHMSKELVNETRPTDDVQEAEKAEEEEEAQEVKEASENVKDLGANDEVKDINDTRKKEEGATGAKEQVKEVTAGERVTETVNGVAIVYEPTARAEVGEAMDKEEVKEAKEEIKEAEAQLVQHAKVKDAAASKTTSFLTALTIPKGVKDPQAKVFGWQLAYDSDSSPPVIGKIRATGLVATWNHAHPDQKILPGDKIVEVNNFPWQGDSKDFADRIAKEFDTLSKSGRAKLRMYLKIQRRAAEDTSTEVASSANAVEKESSQEVLGHESLNGIEQQEATKATSTTGESKAIADDTASENSSGDQQTSDATASEPSAAGGKAAEAQGAAEETAGEEQQKVVAEATDESAAAEESSQEALGYESSEGSEQQVAAEASSREGESKAADDVTAEEGSSQEALGYESSEGSEQQVAAGASSNTSNAIVNDAASESAGEEEKTSDAAASESSAAVVKEATDALKSDNVDDLEGLIAKLQAKVKAKKTSGHDAKVAAGPDEPSVEAARDAEPTGTAEEAADKDVEDALGVELGPEQTTAELQAVRRGAKEEDAADASSATRDAAKEAAEPAENATGEAAQNQLTAELEGGAEEAAEPKAAAEEAAEPKDAVEEAAEPKATAEEAAEPKDAAEEAAEPKDAAEGAAEPKGATEEAAEPNAATEEAAELTDAAEEAAEPTVAAEEATEPKAAAEEAAEPTDAAEEAAEPKAAAEEAAEPTDAAEEAAEPESGAEEAPEPEDAAVQGRGGPAEGFVQEAAEATAAVKEATPPGGATEDAAQLAEEATEQKAAGAAEKVADATLPEPDAPVKVDEKAAKLRAIGNMFKELQDQIRSLKAKVDAKEAAEQTTKKVPSVHMEATQSESTDLSAEEMESLEKKAAELEKAAVEQAVDKWSWPEEQAVEQSVAQEERVEDKSAGQTAAEEETEDKDLKDVEESLGVDFGPEPTNFELQDVKQEAMEDASTAQSATKEGEGQAAELQGASKDQEASKDGLVAELRRQIEELQANFAAKEKAPQEGAAARQTFEQKASEEGADGAARGPDRPQKAAEGLRLILQRAAEGTQAEAADSEGAADGEAAEERSAAEEVAAVLRELEQATAAEGTAREPAPVQLAGKRAAELKAVEDAAAVVTALEEKERATELMGSEATEEDEADDAEDEEEAREVQEAIGRVGQLESNLKTLMGKLSLKVAGKKTVDQKAAASGATDQRAVEDVVQDKVLEEKKAVEATEEKAADEAARQPVASEKKDETVTKQEHGVDTDAIVGMLREIQSEIQTLKNNAAEQKTTEQKAVKSDAVSTNLSSRGTTVSEPKAATEDVARASRIEAKEAAETEAAGEAEARVRAAIEAKAAAKAERDAAEAETAAAEAEAEAAAEATAAAQADAKSAAEAEEFFRSEAKAAAGAEARSREQAAARALAAARAEAKANALEAQLEDLNRRWEKRVEEARQKSNQELVQLREQHREEMDSLEATHASDIGRLELVKKALAKGHNDEDEIRRDERLKAKAELDDLRQRQQQELQELEQEHGQVLNDARQRAEMELVSLQEIQADEQEQLTRLVDGVKSSVLDVMRVVDEAMVGKSSSPTSQDQKLEVREQSISEVEDRLMAEADNASQQQQRVLDLIESFAGRLNKSGILDALDQRLHTREESVAGTESRVSEETGGLAEQRSQIEDVLELARSVGTGKSLDGSVREEKVEEREKGAEDAEQKLASDITAVNEQQLLIADMLSQLEDKVKRSGEIDKPSLRGTTTVAFPHEGERIDADSSVEERDPADAPVEESAVADAPVEEKGAVDVADNAPVEERDHADTLVEQSAADAAAVEEKGAVDVPVQQSAADNAAVEERGAADAPVEQRAANDGVVEEKGAVDTPVDQSVADDAPVEEIAAVDVPVEERTAPQHSFYASSANVLREAWNTLHPQEQIPSEDAMARPGVAHRREAGQKYAAPARSMDLQRPHAAASPAGEFLARSAA
ncbi:unnamed protein product [Prorocentrum cordatum]|uniref:PDZ domain-containing protein n=1 Tax=Prorocentrum cordatum TaxID=2364126 RepID=A0ABN9SNZ2_9DINO|nr:unnamed protein product [Polarella glacialis]